MRLLSLLPLAATAILTAGCCDPETEECELNDTGRDQLEASACPEGFDEAGSSSGLVSNFVVNGVLLQTQHVPGKSYPEGAAACILPNGSGGSFLIETAGEAVARMTVEGSEPGPIDVTSAGAAATVTLELLDEGLSFANGTGFTSGSGSIDSVGDTFSFNLTGIATAESQQVNFNMAMSADKF